MIHINWQWKKFDELSKTELYKMLQIRNEIFIVEKQCPWNEVDGEDKSSLHLLGYDQLNNSNIVAYARLICPKTENTPVHFGRVLVVKEYRNQGISNLIMEQTLAKITDLGYQSRQIDILANYTPITEKLYQKFGFKPTGIPYTIQGGTQLVTMTRLPPKEIQEVKITDINQYLFLNGTTTGAKNNHNSRIEWSSTNSI